LDWIPLDFHLHRWFSKWRRIEGGGWNEGRRNEKTEEDSMKLEENKIAKKKRRSRSSVRFHWNEMEDREDWTRMR